MSRSPVSPRPRMSVDAFYRRWLELILALTEVQSIANDMLARPPRGIADHIGQDELTYFRETLASIGWTMRQLSVAVESVTPFEVCQLQCDTATAAG